MSRSNYDKPFYVDVGTSVVAIRCASNHDVVWSADFVNGTDAIIFLIENACDRMNKEFELYAKSKVAATKPTCSWSVKDALAFANTLANHGWMSEANADAASSCIYALCRMLKVCGHDIEDCMKQMCDRCRAADSFPCLYVCETLNKAKAALEGGAE